MSAMPTAPATSNGSVGVKSSFPIDFSMYDENQHYLLYITDDPTKDHKLKVELKNTSNAVINFTPLQGTEADPWHFELRFRKGALSDKTLNILRGNDKEIKSLLSPDDQNNWAIGLDENSSGTKAYMSLYVRSQGFAALNAGSSMILPLQHISADAGSGARGTRVEFIPHLMKFNDDKQTPLIGNREQHLFITNHSGQKQIPLHVGFVGSNRILNDRESQTTLTLRIQNVAKPSQKHSETPIITLKAKTNTNAESQFIVSFDVQDTDQSKPWALCKSEEIKEVTGDEPKKGLNRSIRLKKKDAGEKSLENSDTGEIKSEMINLEGPSPQLKLTIQEDIYLDIGDYIEIDLSNFRSSLSSGLAHMYLNYNNIPGYWDGHFVLTVEKTPLMFTPYNLSLPTEVQKVGVGFSKPSAKLAVNGGLHVGGDSDPGDNNLLVDGTLYVQGQTTLNGNVGIGVSDSKQRLLVVGNFDSTSTMRDSESGIKYGGQMAIKGNAPQLDFIDTDNNDWAIHVNSNKLYFVRQPWEYGDLVLDGKGNVGIGTDSPSVKLEVKGRIKDEAGYIMPVGAIIAFAGDTAPDGWLMCNGQDIPMDDKYKNLRDLIGNPYRTPKLSGRALIGAGISDSGTTYALRKMDGEEKHLITTNEMPLHSHNYHKPKHNYGHRDGGTDWSRYGHENQGNDDASTSTGGNQPHNNMQPYYVVNYIIKY